MDILIFIAKLVVTLVVFNFIWSLIDLFIKEWHIGRLDSPAKIEQTFIKQAITSLEGESFREK